MGPGRPQTNERRLVAKASTPVFPAMDVETFELFLHQGQPHKREVRWTATFHARVVNGAVPSAGGIREPVCHDSVTDNPLPLPPLPGVN